VEKAVLLRPFDFGVLIPACGAVLASFVLVYSGAGTRYTIQLKGENAEWVFPKDAAETVSVAGPLGDTVVAIQNGTARVISSPCANQSCVARGAIRLQGQWAACLPNKVMVFIGADSDARDSSGGDGTGDVDVTAW
jgi:hypothetical protein